MCARWRRTSTLREREMSEARTPPHEWKWFGNAGHLIVGQDCRFHLCTQVGSWLVSTVGEYLPDSPVREILAESRGIQLEGRGDDRRYDWMRKAGYEEIGYGRKYETMVFRAGSPCDCGCGMPTPDDWGDVDMDGYNDAPAATAGHMALCEKYAAIRAGESQSSAEPSTKRAGNVNGREDAEAKG
jgi:hypothetical protein